MVSPPVSPLVSLLLLSSLSLLSFSADLPSPSYSRSTPCSSDYTRTTVPLPDGTSKPNHPFVPGCHPTSCSRHVFDDFVSPADVARLRSMAERAIEAARGGGGRPGPTIVDVNSGYMRDDEGLANMYEGNEGGLFSSEEYAFYRDTIERIRVTVGETFGLDEGYPIFTSPTFITRIQHDDQWRPKGMHDVYWMEHVDKNNTQHYDYSGLLYLTTQDVDFTGGMFEFVKEAGVGEEGEVKFEFDEAVAPKAGRLITFTAGNENPHKLNIVRGGTRFVLSFWFTCDREMQFENFLDGDVHRSYKTEKKEEGRTGDGETGEL